MIGQANNVGGNLGNAMLQATADFIAAAANGHFKPDKRAGAGEPEYRTDPDCPTRDPLTNRITGGTLKQGINKNQIIWLYVNKWKELWTDVCKHCPQMWTADKKCAFHDWHAASVYHEMFHVYQSGLTSPADKKAIECIAFAFEVKILCALMTEVTKYSGTTADCTLPGLMKWRKDQKDKRKKAYCN